MSSGKLRQIQSKVKNLKSTNKITKAMQLIASAKFASAKKKLGNSDSYYEDVRNLAQIFIQNKSSSVKSSSQKCKNILIGHQSGERMLIIISPDKGLCGNVNQMIKKTFDEYVLKNRGKKFIVFAIGKKISEYVKKNYKTIEVIENEGLVEENLETLFSEKEFKKVEIIYSHFKSIISNEQKLISAFPVLKKRKKDSIEPKNPLKLNCTIEQDIDFFVESISGLLLKACIGDCVNNANLSEISSRMTAMDAATRNGKKMIDALSIQANKLRQAKITNELIDIVSGANAV